MENEQDNIIESQNDEIELDLDSTEETKEKSEETKEEKTKLTEEELLERLEGRAARLRKKLGKTDSPKKEEVKAPSKSGELDYGQKAYLIAKGIKNEEFSLVKSELEYSGYDLENLIDNPYFQQKLKEHRSDKETAEAVPKGSRRPAQPARDSVEYWLAKPYEEVPKEMRRQVLNARLEREKQNSKFSDQPIVS